MATGSSAFGYDGDGNMSLVSAKDASGAVTSQTSYSYDDASRLIGITTPGSSKWQFVYDGASRLRISRSWGWQNTAQGWAWVQNSEKRRVYLGMDVVQERDSQNNVTASYSGGLSARSTASGTVFYGFDGSGNVTTLTDATGAVVGSYTYDAWGNILASSGAKAQENPYRYFGKEQLAGYTFYGYRFYSSGLGRWINRDPIEEDGGINLYGMVENDPIDVVDLYGEYGVSDFIITLGQVAGGAGAKFGWGIESGLQLGLHSNVITMVLLDAKSTAAHDGYRPRPTNVFVPTGNLKGGWIHIQAKHISDNHPTEKGDLMPPTTTKLQVEQAACQVVAEGQRLSYPDSPKQTFTKHMKVNGFAANYTAVVLMRNGEIVTFYPTRSYR